MASLIPHQVVIPEPLLAETFEQLKACGQGRNECVVYWLGPLDAPGLIDEVAHPDHRWGYGGYEVDDRWLTRLWFDLARRRKCVRIQVHTHPHIACHSQTDDDFAVVHTPGFLSLVLPDFAGGPRGLQRAFLAERTQEGGWREVRPEERLLVVP